MGDVWGLADAELLSGVEEEWAAEQRHAARRLALIAEIDARGVAVAAGASSTAVWLRHRLRIDAAVARQMVALARGLARSLPATAKALADAEVHEGQARVINHAVGELPDEIGPELRDEAERVLIGFAGQFSPSPLARLGARILEHVAPEVAERHERESLERGEARAWRDRFFSLVPDGPGRVRVSGCLDGESAATVSAAIESLCSPAGARVTAGGDVAGGEVSAETAAGDNVAGDNVADDRFPGQRRADALVQVCRLVLAGGRLPTHGGQRPQVMVTMPFEPWRAEAVGRLGDGQRVSPATLRRIACDADLIPVVLGGEGQVLDVGRSRRLFPAPLRRALVARDVGCAFPGCDRPASWCEAHHIVPWSSGGVTSVDSGVLLCRRHHRLIHEGDWLVRLGADRMPEFIPPSYVDPERAPRRNPYHRRT